MEKETREMILAKIDELTIDISINAKMVEKDQFAEYNELENAMLRFRWIKSSGRRHKSRSRSISSNILERMSIWVILHPMK